ncbi:rho-associated protein kinase 1-like, partial [Engraulis encrasicolus]|uniref:rho-associated protein kinase 1-like n=1 Tax=Engraulis encrasicolus TaxID=184585 RepID=UPI002FD6FD1B
MAATPFARSLWTGASCTCGTPSEDRTCDRVNYNVSGNGTRVKYHRVARLVCSAQGPGLQEHQREVEELGQSQRRCQQMIQLKEEELQELRKAVETLKSGAQTAVEDSERMFAELFHSIGRRCSEVTELIRAQEKAEVSRVEELLKRLEQEIAELKRTDAEMKELSQTKDAIHFLKMQLEEKFESVFKREIVKISAAGRNHTMFDATGQLQERICPLHKKVFEIFCRTDQSCICYLCTMEDHRGHDTITAKAEWSHKKEGLGQSQRRCQQIIQLKEKELQELRKAVETLKSGAQTAVEESERMFAEMIRSVERRCSEVTELIRAQEKAEVSRAEGLLKRLEQEIAELKRTDAEMKQLSQTQDPIYFLK